VLVALGGVVGAELVVGGVVGVADTGAEGTAADGTVGADGAVVD
jgi:hypothetical protein